MGEALRMVHDFLGDDWSLIFSEANAGASGNIERVAFCFDTRRAQAMTARASSGSRPTIRWKVAASASC